MRFPSNRRSFPFPGGCDIPVAHLPVIISPIFRSFLLFIALFLTTLPARAETEDGATTTEKRPFGTFTQSYVDLSVKTRNGGIQMTRVWDGHERKWHFNPQYDKLELTDFVFSDKLGRLIAAQIRRGGERFRTLRSSAGGGNSGDAIGCVPEKEKEDGGLASAFSIDPDLRTLAFGHIAGLNIENCLHTELAFRSSSMQGGGCGDSIQTGYTYRSGIGSAFYQYSGDGNLLFFGLGDQLIGRMLYDQASGGKLRGIADVDQEELVSIDRDSSGRIRQINGPEGETVRYEYGSGGLLSDVFDAEGGHTHYEYTSDRRISSITTGPGEEDENTVTVKYYGDGRLKSLKDSIAPAPTTFTQEYFSTKKIYLETIRYPDGTVERRYSDQNGKILRVEKNDDPIFRTADICEDTVIADDQDRVTYIDRDHWWRVRQIIYPDRSIAKFEHTIENWPRIDIDPDGVSASAQAKPWGITAYISPAGRRVEYLRDVAGRIKEATEFLADSEVDPEDPAASRVRKWIFEHDSYGRTKSRRLQLGADPNPSTDFFEAFDENNFEVERTDARGKIWRYRFDEAWNLIELENPLGNIWKFSYNHLGLPTRYEDPEGFIRRFEYTKQGYLKKLSEKYDATLPEAVTTYRTDARGRLVSMIDAAGKEWRNEYNESVRSSKRIDPVGNTFTYFFDHRERLAKVFGPDDELRPLYEVTYQRTAPRGTPSGKTILEKFRTRERETQLDTRELPRLVIEKTLTGEIVRKLFYSYTSENLLQSVRLDDGVSQFETTYTHDSHHRIRSVTAPGWGTTSYRYFNSGKEIRVVQPGGAYTTFSFGQGGLLDREIDAQGNETRYSYDDAGRLAGVITPRGITAQYSYDRAGKDTGVSFVSTGAILTTGELPPLEPTMQWTWGYNLRGDLTSMSDNHSSSTWTIDSLGRVSSSTTDFGPFEKSHAYTYTDDGAVKTYQTPLGETFTYTWNKFGLPESIDIPGEGTVTYQYAADVPTRLREIDYPGGMTQSYKYNTRGEPIELLTNSSTGSALMYHRNTFGRRGELTNRVTEDGTYTYDHDTALRVTRFSGPGFPEEQFTYDDLGRRSPAGETWQYNNLGAILNTGDSQYTYDKSGNRITQTSPAASFTLQNDLADRLARVITPTGATVATYQHNPLGHRVSKEVSSQRRYFYHTETGLAAEFDSDGNPLRSYLYAPDAPWGTAPLLAKNFESGGFSRVMYYQNDVSGTPFKAIDKTGNVRWSARYHLDGSAITTGATFDNPLRFPGQYRDSETGLHYNLLRSYDPAAAQFLSQDPYGILATGPNRYLYGNGNPVDFIDPTGEFAFALPVVYGLGIAFLTNEAYTGFQVTECTRRLLVGCDDLSEFVNCLENFIGAQVEVGVGVVETARNDCLFGSDLKRAHCVLNALGRGPWQFQLFANLYDSTLYLATADPENAFWAALRALPGKGGKGGNPVLRAHNEKASGLNDLSRAAGAQTNRIRGFTKHGINRAIGDGGDRAGVTPKALLDTLRNPTKVVKGTDQHGRPYEIFIGKDARVVVNPETGKVVSMNPLSGAGANQ